VYYGGHTSKILEYLHMVLHHNTCDTFNLRPVTSTKMLPNRTREIQETQVEHMHELVKQALIVRIDREEREGN
jgi:hypothetical protein